MSEGASLTLEAVAALSERQQLAYLSDRRFGTVDESNREAWSSRILANLLDLLDRASDPHAVTRLFKQLTSYATSAEHSMLLRCCQRLVQLLAAQWAGNEPLSLELAHTLHIFARRDAHCLDDATGLQLIHLLAQLAPAELSVPHMRDFHHVLFHCFVSQARLLENVLSYAFANAHRCRDEAAHLKVSLSFLDMCLGKQPARYKALMSRTMLVRPQGDYLRALLLKGYSARGKMFCSAALNMPFLQEAPEGEIFYRLFRANIGHSETVIRMNSCNLSPRAIEEFGLEPVLAFLLLRPVVANVDKMHILPCAARTDSFITMEAAMQFVGKLNLLRRTMHTNYDKKYIGKFIRLVSEQLGQEESAARECFNFQIIQQMDQQRSTYHCLLNNLYSLPL